MPPPESPGPSGQNVLSNVAIIYCTRRAIPSKSSIWDGQLDENAFLEKTYGKKNADAESRPLDRRPLDPGVSFCNT